MCDCFQWSHVIVTILIMSNVKESLDYTPVFAMLSMDQNYPYRKVRSWQACRKLVLSLQQKYELVLGRTRLSRGPASSPTICALLCKLAQANMNTFVRAYVSFSTRCKLVQAKMNKFVHAGEFNYQMQA